MEREEEKRDPSATLPPSPLMCAIFRPAGVAERDRYKGRKMAGEDRGERGK